VLQLPSRSANFKSTISALYFLANAKKASVSCVPPSPQLFLILVRPPFRERRGAAGASPAARAVRRIMDSNIARVTGPSACSGGWGGKQPRRSTGDPPARSVRVTVAPWPNTGTGRGTAADRPERAPDAASQAMRPRARDRRAVPREGRIRGQEGSARRQLRGDGRLPAARNDTRGDEGASQSDGRRRARPNRTVRDAARWRAP